VRVEFGHRRLTEAPPWGGEPLALLLDQHGAGEADHRCSIGEDADHFRSPADLSVQPFQQVGRVQLPPVLSGKGQAG